MAQEFHLVVEHLVVKIVLRLIEVTKTYMQEEWGSRYLRRKIRSTRSDGSTH